MSTPRPSSFKTVGLPVLGTPNAEAIRVGTSEASPVRVVVRNDPASVGVARIGYDNAGELNSSAGINSGSFWDLAPGETDIFVLGPKQVLVAIAFGGPARFSVAQSDAFPIVLKGSDLRALLPASARSG